MAKKKARRDEDGIVLFDHKDLALSIQHILKGGPQRSICLDNFSLVSAARLIVDHMAWKN
jgi:hypothetical protein